MCLLVVATYLGLGSNMGDRKAHLAHAIAAFGNVGWVTGVSGIYETAPQGYVDQPAFLNMVTRLETPLAPERLLERIRTIERERGRIRTFPNAPRTLDIDILLFGDRVVDERGLRIPHPRMRERAFVLVPLLELEPGLVDPETGRPFTGPETHHGVRRVMSGEELLDASSR